MDSEVGGSVCESNVVEMKAADESSERTERMVDDRTHGGMDFEGDEVFEEAVVTHEHLQEHQLNTGLENLPLNQSSSIEGISDSRPLEADGNSSAEQGMDEFHEAIGAPKNVVTGKVVLKAGIQEKMQDSMSGDAADECSVVGKEAFVEDSVVSEVPFKEDATGTVDEGSVGDGSNVLANNGLLHSEKDVRLDATNVNGNEELEVLKNGNEVGVEPATVLYESENGHPPNETSEGEPILEETGNRDAGDIPVAVHSCCPDAAFSGDTGIQDDTAQDSETKMAKHGIEYQNDNGVEVNRSVYGQPTDKGEDVGHNFLGLDSGNFDVKAGDVNNASAVSDLSLHDVKFDELMDSEVNGASTVSNLSFHDELKGSVVPLVDDSQDNRTEEPSSKMADLSSDLDKSVGVAKAVSEMDSQIVDVKMAEVNDSSTIDELKDSILCLAEGGQDNMTDARSETANLSGDLHRTLKKGKENSEIGSPPVKHSSDLGPQDSKVFQAQRVMGNAELRDIHAVVQQSTRDAVVDVKRPHAKGNINWECQPAVPASSVSRKSENAAPSPAHPAGLGRAAPLLEPAARPVQLPRVNGSVSQVQSRLTEDPANAEAEETDETREKLQMIRVKFLRLARRLGQTPHNVVVAQVLYRLGLAEQLRGRNSSRAGAFSFDRASDMAEQLEAAGQEPLDFSCTIMVLGKTGVGKSATINSIFDEPKFGTDAFHLGTKKVQDVVGTVQGIKVRVIDTPGLLTAWSDQRQNEKILQSVKSFIKKTPPDIVLYLDRLDMQSREFGDMPLLRTITEAFGPSIWFNAIVVLTHAASAPPDGPNGMASSYDTFVTQRSHVVQQAVRQAAGDMRLMNPVSLVENHSACRTNRAGQRVLPNGQVWKPHLLLLSFASKILAEANALLKLQDSPPGKPFAIRSRAPPLPYLLSSLIQSRPHLKLPEEQSGDDDMVDDDLYESSDSDSESDYDELPPFKSLTKVQLQKLSTDQRRAYFDEVEYREKLFMKKQLKEERKRRKMMKKMAESVAGGEYGDTPEEEDGSAASVPVPMADLALPASFDSDNPTHRYRFLESSNQWVIRPVLDTHGWDHDVGYEGINAEKVFVVKDRIPLSFSGQVTKDKKDANMQLEVMSSMKHGLGKVTSLGFDIQSIGKDMIYTMRSETRFSNHRKNKATAGVSATLLGDAVSAGVKLEDKVILNKRFQVVVTGGAMTGNGDVAYGGSMEATLRDKDCPLGRSLTTLGVSVMDWHGDLAIGGNVQSQVPVGRFMNMILRGNLNNRGTGQISIRLSSSEQWSMVLIGLVPLVRKLFGNSQDNNNQHGQW